MMKMVQSGTLPIGLKQDTLNAVREEEALIEVSDEALQLRLLLGRIKTTSTLHLLKRKRAHQLQVRRNRRSSRGNVHPPVAPRSEPHPNARTPSPEALPRGDAPSIFETTSLLAVPQPTRSPCLSPHGHAPALARTVALPSRCVRQKSVIRAISR